MKEYEGSIKNFLLTDQENLVVGIGINRYWNFLGLKIFMG